MGAGLLLGILGSIFWKGAGGLALVGGAVWVAINGGFELGALQAAAVFAAPGALFIACGWYMLAQRSRHATGATT